MGRRALVVINLSFLFLIIFSVPSFSRTIEKIRNTLKASTVYIEVWNADEELIQVGTGTVINKKGDKYYILTNGHVVTKKWDFINEPVPFEDDEFFLIVYPHDNLLSDSSNQHPGYEVVEYFYWVAMDLAVLVVDYDDAKIFGVDQPKEEDYVEFIPLKIGSSLNMKELDTVYAAGYPIVVGNVKANYTPSIFITKAEINSFIEDEEGLESSGNYSIIYRAGLQGGMSGGPLVNSKGELIGINGLTEAAYSFDSDVVNPKMIPRKSIYDYAIMIEDFVLHALLDDEFNNNPESIFYGYLPKIKNSYKKKLLDAWDNDRYLLPGVGYKSDLE